MIPRAASRYLIAVVAGVLIAGNAHAFFTRSELFIDGTVLCRLGGETKDVRPAGNVIVKAGSDDAAVSATDENGFYRIKVRRPPDDVYVTLKFSHLDREIAEHRGLIDRGQIREAGGAAYFKWKTMTVEVPCASIRTDDQVAIAYLAYLEGERVSAAPLMSRSQGPGEQKGWVPAALGMLKFLALGFSAGAGGEQPITTQEYLAVESVSGRTVEGGQMFWYAQGSLSQNVGFNFSARRDLSESLFWNVADMAQVKSTSFHLLTDYRNIIKTTFMVPVAEDAAVGIGFMGLAQRDSQTVIYAAGTGARANRFATKDSAVYLGAGSAITETTAVGAAVKWLYQSVDTPRAVLRTTDTFPSGQTTITDTLVIDGIHSRETDLDLSVTQTITPSFKVGLSVLNVFGAQLVDMGEQRTLRSGGVGGAYSFDEVSIGANYFKRDDRDDAAFGLDYTPTREVRFNAGYDIGLHALSLGCRLYSFDFLYSNDDRMGDTYQIGFNITF